MELTVLAVPDCPNAPLLAERLADIVMELPDVTVKRQVVSEEAEALRHRPTCAKHYSAPGCWYRQKEEASRAGRCQHSGS